MPFEDVFVIAFFGFFVLAPLLMLRRNVRVHQYRRDVIEKIAQLNRRDLERLRSVPLREWPTVESMLWRFDMFESERPTYHEMVWKFWIPVEQFYTGHPVIDESLTRKPEIQ